MRGGRGGGRGGRGSYTRRVDAHETPAIYRPRPEWPETTIPKKREFSSFEKDAVVHFVQFRQQMRDGPLYTFLDVQVIKSKSNSKVDDPFESLPTYQRKYTKTRRTVPKLSERNYVAGWFPDELKATIDPSLRAASKASEHQKKKQKQKQTALDVEDDELEAEAEEEEELVEHEQDDDFEEDELEGDDYNAEQYFDNGEDDGLDDADDGDGGGGGGDYD